MLSFFHPWLECMYVCTIMHAFFHLFIHILQYHCRQFLGAMYTSSPNNLRIMGGVVKGRAIASPAVYLRPMMAKVREALFSSLTSLGSFDSHAARVLDIFSGAGSVGLEALSRGAKHATFVDLSPDCVQTCLSNARALGFEGQVMGLALRAEEVLVNPPPQITETYSLVTLTPPYLEVSYTELVRGLCSSRLLDADSIVAIEYPVEMGSLPYLLSASTVLPDTRLGNLKALKKSGMQSSPPMQDEKDAVLFGLRNRRYGRTVIAIYVFRPSVKYDMRPEEFVSI
ncbi:hypothetical protein EON64_06760 [archaeon]|nr:MAG: hypothetical protein EON64_06760 [archaeon]